MIEFRRKLYKRGSSYETTIPMALLMTLGVDIQQKNHVVFKYDSKEKKCYIDIEHESQRKL